MCFFAHINIIFDKITAIFDFDISDISLQYCLNVLRVMGEDGARGKDWLRARGITCVLPTQYSIFYYNSFYLILLVSQSKFSGTRKFTLRY